MDATTSSQPATVSRDGAITCTEVGVIANVFAGRKTARSGIRFAFWMALMSVFYLLLEVGGH